MQFAIAIPTDANSWRLVRRAEELGFARAWFYDTQMLVEIRNLVPCPLDDGRSVPAARAERASPGCRPGALR